MLIVVAVIHVKYSSSMLNVHVLYMYVCIMVYTCIYMYYIP